MKYDNLRQQVLKVASQPEYNDALRAVLGEGALKVLTGRVNRLNDENLYVAVLGRQGAGKSSLINLLLFSKEVMPVEIDETTNVICKVVHDRGKGPGADIIFESGRIDSGPATREFLAQFVDEQMNPDNKKKVREAVVRCIHPGLSGGISFIDTPGVDSLKMRNQQTTMNFLPNVSCAIFLFSTTPTLLQSEINFLRLTWEFSKKFFFVQNIWGEGIKDIGDAQSDNMKKIIELAREKGDDPSDLRVFAVDIHKALEGACNSDSDLYEQSGIGPLNDALGNFIGRGSGRLLLHDAIDALGQGAADLGRGARARINSIKTKHEETDGQFRERIDIQKDNLRLVKEDWAGAKNEFDLAVREAEKQFDEASEAELGAAKKDLKDFIGRGKAGSVHVGKAIVDKISVAAKKAVDVYHQGVLVATSNLQKAYESGLKSAENTINFFEPQQAADAAGFIETGESVGGVIKNVSGFALGVLGLDALFVIGTAAAGAASGGVTAAAAAAATAAAAIPVAGILVAGAALLVGLGAKSYFSGQKKGRLIDVLDEAIDSARRNIKQAAHRHYRSFTAEIKRRMDDDMRRELDEKQELLTQLEMDRSLGQHDVEALINRLSHYIMLSNNLRGQVRQLRQEVEADG